MKKIGIITGSFPSISETFILNQILSFIELGYEVNILSYKKNEYSNIHNRIKKYNLLNKTQFGIQQPVNYFNRLTKFLNFLISNFPNLNWKLLYRICIKNLTSKNLYNLHLFFRYSLFLKTKDVDLFIIHFGTNALKLVELKKMGIYKNKKMIVHFHGFDLELNDLKLNRKRYKDLFDLVDLFVVNTPYLKNILNQTCPTLSNFITIPVGLYLPIKSPNVNENKYDRFTIVFCGRLINWKGPDLVIEIADKLINNLDLEIDFKIIGDGVMINDLRSMVRHRKLEKHVELTGALAQEEVFTAYQKSHLFLLPGIHDPRTGRAETQGLVIQEAQYFELPVLVSNAGGMKYGLIDGDTGFVLKQYDIDGFVDKIKQLYYNEELRRKMGRLGKSYVEQNFNILHITQNLINEISKV